MSEILENGVENKETPTPNPEPEVEQKETPNPTEPSGKDKEKEETPEEKEDTEEKEFNPDEMDFEEPEVELDTTPYENLKEFGIDIDSKDFKNNVNLLNECGMNDPEVISNFLKKVHEKQAELNKKPSAKEVSENLRKNLSQEEKAQYKAIGNMFKNIFNNDEEAMALVNRDIMSNPYMVRLVNEIRKYYTGNGTQPKNTPANTVKNTNTTDFETGVKEVNAEITKILKTNKKISKSEKERIIQSVRAKIKPQDLDAFNEYYN